MECSYDTKEDITFVGAYPVTEPLFLHMWMNHPSNGEAHYITRVPALGPIYQKSTMYSHIISGSRRSMAKWGKSFKREESNNCG